MASAAAVASAMASSAASAMASTAASAEAAAAAAGASLEASPPRPSSHTQADSLIALRMKAREHEVRLGEMLKRMESS